MSVLHLPCYSTQGQGGSVAHPCWHRSVRRTSCRTRHRLITSLTCGGKQACTLAAHTYCNGGIQSHQLVFGLGGGQPEGTREHMQTPSGKVVTSLGNTTLSFQRNPAGSPESVFGNTSGMHVRTELWSACLGLISWTLWSLIWQQQTSCQRSAD